MSQAVIDFMHKMSQDSMFRKLSTQEIPNVFSKILEDKKRIVVISRGTHLNQIKHVFSKLRESVSHTISYQPYHNRMYNITTGSEIRFLTTGPSSREKLARWNALDEVFLYGVDPIVPVWRDVCKIITTRRNEEDEIENVSQVLLDNLINNQ